jgi:Fe-S oxidoreductase
MGGHYQVIHHSQFIDQLVKTGKITLNPSLEGALTYHDPCYLGRYNSVYDEPRSILKSLPKTAFGAGSAWPGKFLLRCRRRRMWMEETIGKRINLERAEEIVARQAWTNVAVGCPFCLTMIEDGMKDLEKEEEIKTRDIAELVARI